MQYYEFSMSQHNTGYYETLCQDMSYVTTIAASLSDYLAVSDVFDNNMNIVMLTLCVGINNQGLLPMYC